MRCNLHDYDIMEEGKEPGIAIGEKRGITIGEERAKLEAARNMLMEGVPVDKIASWQALPIETVQQLAAKLQPVAKLR